MNEIIENDVKNIIERIGNKIQLFDDATILITGASGLIGSYIVETLAYANSTKILKNPVHILALQKSKITSESKLGYLLHREDIDFIQHDAAEPLDVPYELDYIVHSAGMSAPAFFLADPLGTVDVNVNGIRWILEYARQHSTTGVLYMSSGEIYGNPPPEYIPTPETYSGNASTIGVRACYTSSKRLAETLCSIYFEKFGVPIKIARPFIVYGPGLSIKDKRVMAEFIRSGLEGKPIVMLSKGLDTRSYCYIADATVAFLEMLLSNANGEVFNVASDKEEVSIHDLAVLVHKLCDIKQDVAIQEQQVNFIQGAPNRVLPDISKLKKMFGYEPLIGIEEGLRRTIAWNKAIFY